MSLYRRILLLIFLFCYLFSIMIFFFMLAFLFQLLFLFFLFFLLFLHYPLYLLKSMIIEITLLFGLKMITQLLEILIGNFSIIFNRFMICSICLSPYLPYLHQVVFILIRYILHRSHFHLSIILLGIHLHINFLFPYWCVVDE